MPMNVENGMIDFYFDFMSPFAYLAQKRLPELAARYGYGIVYKPFDLPSAKKAAGNFGPSNREVPAKLRYLTADMNRWAARYGVPLKFPSSFASQRMNIGTFFAQERNKAQEYVTAAYGRAWASGEDMSDTEVLAGLAREMNWAESEFVDYIDSPVGAQRFEAANLEAQSRGVFGAPTMLIGDDMWWGNDRLDFLEEYLKQKSEKAA